jgi:PAS domain-containing protein
MGTPKADHLTIRGSDKEQSTSFQFVTESRRRSLTFLTNPLQQLMIIVVAIFLAEAVTMVILASLPPLSLYAVTFLDSLCLIIIVFPILYFFMLRPLRLHIAEVSRIEKVLRESEEKYRSFIESTDDSIYLVDRKYTYLYMNKRHITRMGFSGDKYMGRAAILKTTYRESDVVARIGGDEFVVLPVGRSGDNVDIILARLQENLDHHVRKSNLAYRLSISFGISCYDPESPRSIDELIIQAEKSMYEQKRQKQKPLL